MSRIDDYWARFFGLTMPAYLAPELNVIPHFQLRGYRGAWIFRHGSSCVVTVPPEMVAEVEMKLRGSSPDTFSNRDFLTLFGDRVDKVIGPAYQGWLEESDFRPVASAARLLSVSDDDAMRKMEANCDAVEWEHADIEVGHHPTFGYFVSDLLISAANYRVDGAGAARFGIITHPSYRGRGYGKSALNAATQHGIESGLLMLYQTLVENQAAVAAAESLGYRRYATQLAVRLR